MFFILIISDWVDIMPGRESCWRQKLKCHNATGHERGDFFWPMQPGPWFNIKMKSYQYRKSHSGDKTIWRPSYLHNGISYTGKMTSLYWIGAQYLFIYLFLFTNDVTLQRSCHSCAHQMITFINWNRFGTHISPHGFHAYKQIYFPSFNSDF